MTQTLTIIGHSMAFNKEQSQNHIVSYKRTNSNNSNEKTNSLINLQKMNEKQICNTATNDNH